jgi:hypothetical protein
VSAAFEVEAEMVAATLSGNARKVLEAFYAEPAQCVLEDLASLRSGMTSSALLDECIDANDEGSDDACCEYVAALEAHLAKEDAR